MNINAFIFDLDGVITDTAVYHYQAWKRVADKLGVRFNENDNEALKGVSRRDSLLYIAGKAERELDESELNRLMYEKNEDYKQLIRHITDADIFPGVVRLIKALHARDMKIGLASASKNAQTIIDRLGLSSAFDYIADAASIANGKPAPDIFLDVMHHFKCRPEECVGIEDAAAGVEAIKAAGMFAVGIGSPDTLQEADMVYADIKSLNLEDVLQRAASA